MKTFFSNILVPVDFSVNTDVAVEKAMWLAVPQSSIIHLLHVEKPISKSNTIYFNGFLVPVQAFACNPADARQKLHQLKRKIEMSLTGVTVVTHHLHEENVQRGITCLAKQLRPSLIIIGGSRSHKWFSYFKKVNPSVLAKETNCAILTVKPGSLPNKMKSIVMPVSSFPPTRKIELLLALTRNHRPVVHLVTMYHEEQQNRRADVFLDAYRTLSDYLHYPVEFKTLKGRNIAKAVLDYAQFIMADFIIANPVEETKMSSIYRTDICDALAPESKLNILTAEPFHN